MQMNHVKTKEHAEKMVPKPSVHVKMVGISSYIFHRITILCYINFLE